MLAAHQPSSPWSFGPPEIASGRANGESKPPQTVRVTGPIGWGGSQGRVETRIRFREPHHDGCHFGDVERPYYRPARLATEYFSE
jgi:hypothetical protein